ncbi:MAG: S1/P1 nuclease [Betaproteobacteria bacterium]|nr:S1/P1 nuclease [Betaproteobacteria bacterium]
MKRWFFLLVGCLPLTAMAWNAAGHRQIAALAWEVMEEPIRQQAVILIKQHPDYSRWRARQQEEDPDYGAFLEAAIWADDIRRDKRFYSSDEPETPLLPGFPNMARHGDWHYQDEAGGQLAKRLPELAEILANSTRGQDERAYALVWLLHLVGDLHQPLHTQGRSDRGGNLFNARFFARPHERISLHRYWDDLPGPLWLRGERLRASLPDIERTQDGGKPGAVKNWLAESRALVERGVYPPGEDGEISPEFHQQAKATARQRIALAGYRLGMWLNQLLA